MFEWDGSIQGQALNDVLWPDNTDVLSHLWP